MSITLTDDVKVDLPKVRCRRCGHRWVPRKVSPKRCPDCKTPYWKTERIAAAIRGAIDELAPTETERRNGAR